MNLVETLKAAAGNNQESLRVLYEYFYKPLYRFVYMRVKNKEDAVDIVQTVFMKVFRNIDRVCFDTEAMLAAYIYTAARNTLIDHYRKDGRISHIEDDKLGIVMDLQGGEEFETNYETKNLVASLINILPENQKEIIEMKFIQGYDAKEIAAILGKSHDSVRQILSRALRSVREEMKVKDLL